MQIKVQLVFEDDAGKDETVEIAQLQRDTLSSVNLGLTLAESKKILHNLQVHLVEQQVADYQQHQRSCPHCQQPRRAKDQRSIVYKTLFGKLTLPSDRLFQCECQPHETKSFSPLSELLPERTTPELLYLESKFAALMSYGLSVRLLAEVLPMDNHLNAATIRNHTQRLGDRLDAELGDEQFMFVEGCERDWEELPRPDLPLSVGIDGAYVRSSERLIDAKRAFEVIVGKSIADDGSSRSFSSVQDYDEKPKRRLFELLKAQGMQMNQQVTFLSDGGDTVRELQLYLNPQAEHLLDWFHITMRITVMNQMAKGIKTRDQMIGTEALETLESIKWYLWHGNVFRALQEIESLFFSLDTDRTTPEQRKLLKIVEEFDTYIRNNRPFIPNYGDRYRNGERISTGFVESTVNQVVSQQMVKKQQMRWSRKGAHRLLQVRTHVLDGEWRHTFERWYACPAVAVA
jgi:hypothetical protein